MDNYEAYIKPLMERLDKLKELGFTSYEELRVKGGDVLHRWIRILPWKKDVVQVSHFKKDPRACGYDFQVYLIVDGRDVIFAAPPATTFKHREIEYKFPQLFKGLRASSVVEDIAGDILGSLDWFNDYADKKVCLTRIKEAKDGDHIMRTNAPIYPAVEKLLST